MCSQLHRTTSTPLKLRQNPDSVQDPLLVHKNQKQVAPSRRRRFSIRSVELENPLPSRQLLFRFSITTFQNIIAPFSSECSPAPVCCTLTAKRRPAPCHLVLPDPKKVRLVPYRWKTTGTAKNDKKSLTINQIPQASRPGRPKTRRRSLSSAYLNAFTTDASSRRSLAQLTPPDRVGDSQLRRGSTACLLVFLMIILVVVSSALSTSCC